LERQVCELNLLQRDRLYPVGFVDFIARPNDKHLIPLPQKDNWTPFSNLLAADAAHHCER